MATWRTRAPSMSVALDRKLAEQGPEAFLPDLASSLHNLGAIQSSLGQREAALTSTQEAVALDRKLAEQRPEAFLPNLASSLNNLGIRQSELGQREAALASVEEAFNVIWPFFLRFSPAFERNTRIYLDNLRNYLAALGRSPSPAQVQRIEIFAAKCGP